MASPADFIEDMVFNMTLFDIELLQHRIFLYCPASILLMSFRFQSPVATIGVPM